MPTEAPSPQLLQPTSGVAKDSDAVEPLTVRRKFLLLFVHEGRKISVGGGVKVVRSEPRLDKCHELVEVRKARGTKDLRKKERRKEGCMKCVRGKGIGNIKTVAAPLSNVIISSKVSNIE